MNSPDQSNNADNLKSRALSLLEELDQAEKLKVLEYLQAFLALKDK